MSSRVATHLGALLVPVAVVGAWQLLGVTVLAGYEFLPSPGEVARALADLARSGELVRDAGHTLRIALSAAVITLTVGAGVGFAIGSFPALRMGVMATVDVLRTIPAVALVPIALMALGPVPQAELLLAVYASTWPVLVTTASGVAACPARLDDVAATLRLSRVERVRKIVVPTTVPAWLVGARLSVVVALLVAIVAEMLIYPRGLGGGLIESLHALAPARMWAYAVICGVIGMTLNSVLRQSIRMLLPGSPTHRGRDAAVAAPAASALHAPLRGLLPLIALLAVWQLFGTPQSLSFPPPGSWLAALVDLYRDGVLATAAGHSLVSYFLGLGLAVVLGTAAGSALGWSRLVDHWFTPTMDFAAAIPAAALVPVAALLLGPTLLAGVACVALIVAWPIALSTTAAMQSIPPVRLDVARTLGLSPLRRWSRVVAPSLWPGVIVGVRVASALAVIVTLLVDVFGTGSGIGRLLVLSQQHFDSPAVWGLLLLVGGFGYLSSALLATVARRSSP
jgi:sulfonate transport system permease protein